MNEWGNNPATYQAIGSIATAFGLIAIFISWQSLKETKAQRKAIENEMASRMRPWVGLFGCSFTLTEKEQIRLLLKNYGTLPAQNSHSKVTISPTKWKDDERENTIRWEEIGGEKALLPTEDGNYKINLSDYPQFDIWITDRRDIILSGFLDYTLNGIKFYSEFEVRLKFANKSLQESEELAVGWRNKKAF